MIPTFWQVFSGIVALAVSYLSVLLILGGIGQLGVRLGWWKKPRPLNLPRHR